MSNETHNGWTNRETWSLMLWISNDEGFSTEFREVADQGAEAVKELAETYFTVAGYEEATGEFIPDALAEIALEIGSLWRVNWEEATAALLNN